MCKIFSQLAYGVAYPNCSAYIDTYIQRWKLHVSGIKHIPFSVGKRCRVTIAEPCNMAELFVGFRHLQIYKKRNAPCLHLWSATVTAWSAISSSPTGAASCEPGRQPKQPPAPRMLSVAACGRCSTSQHRGMTWVGRGRWTGQDGAGPALSHRLKNESTL